MSDEKYRKRLRDEIIGLPLTDMWRIGLQVFEFGEQEECLNRKGETYYSSQKRIHVSCSWRISKNKRLILGSDDYADPDSEVFETQNYTDFFTQVEAASLIVEDIIFGEFNDLDIILSNGYKLQLLLIAAGFYESWRYINEDPAHHVVARPDGLDDL